MEGANSKIVIEAPTASTKAVERMLDFIYLDTYEDGDDETVEAGVPGEHPDVGKTEISELYSTTPSVNVRKFLNNVRLYGLADYYQVPLLKKRAFDRCCALLKKCSQDEYKFMAAPISEVRDISYGQANMC